jgi:hypothetical protein
MSHILPLRQLISNYPSLLLDVCDQDTHMKFGTVPARLLRSTPTYRMYCGMPGVPSTRSRYRAVLYSHEYGLNVLELEQRALHSCF